MCAGDLLFTNALLPAAGLNGASKKESHDVGSSNGLDSPGGASTSTSLGGSQCYAHYLSLLGYSKKAFSYLPTQDNKGAPMSCNCSLQWFILKYTQYIDIMSSAAFHLLGQQERHQELHLLLPPLLLACAASLQHACKQDMPADPMQVALLAVSCRTAALQHWDLIQRQKQPRAPVWR